MEKVYSEFVDYDINKKKELWANSVYIFDTNVLLNLYRYSKNTRNDLFDVFEKLEERMWMPSYVGLEYFKNRCTIIHETKTNAEKKKSTVIAEIRKINKENRLFDNSEISELEKYATEWFDKQINENILVSNFSEDSILERILKIYLGRVSKRITPEEIVKKETEFNERVELNIPPGCFETKEDNKFGDYIIWTEIMDYALSEKKNIIFVTSDLKEDWFWKVSGKTVSPRYELIKEFNEKTKRDILIYKMNNFLKLFKEMNVSSEISDSTIDEVSYQTENIFNKLEKIKVFTDEHKSTFKLRNDISNMNTHNFNYSDFSEKEKVYKILTETAKNTNIKLSYSAKEDYAYILLLMIKEVASRTLEQNNSEINNYLIFQELHSQYFNYGQDIELDEFFSVVYKRLSRMFIGNKLRV